MLVLLLYEYIITLDREVGLIWKRRKRPLSVVPLIFFIVGVIVAVIPDIFKSDDIF